MYTDSVNKIFLDHDIKFKQMMADFKGKKTGRETVDPRRDSVTTTLERKPRRTTLDITTQDLGK